MWESSLITNKIEGEIPFMGASLGQQQWSNDKMDWYGNVPDSYKTWFEVHGGLPGINIKDEYSLHKPEVERSISGGAGIKAILGLEAGYGLKSKKL